MSNGKILRDLKKMVDEGKPLTAAQYRTFMLSVAMDAQEERKLATKERKAIIITVDAKIAMLEKKIEHNPTACSQAETNKEEIIRIRNKSDRNDLYVTLVTIIGSISAALFGTK